MGTETIRLSEVVAAKPAEVYAAWLSAREHTAFTGGGKATVEPRVGGRHTAHDGYIHGWTLVLEPGRRIVQSWRTTEFPPESPDSVLEVKLAAVRGGTRVSLVHRAIPAGQGERYQGGWREYYLDTMKAYFAKRAKAPAKPARGASRAR
jgi:uncharacterized protein YndB with AHSA1/START domain